MRSLALADVITWINKASLVLYNIIHVAHTLCAMPRFSIRSCMTLSSSSPVIENRDWESQTQYLRLRRWHRCAGTMLTTFYHMNVMQLCMWSNFSYYYTRTAIYQLKQQYWNHTSRVRACNWTVQSSNCTAIIKMLIGWRWSLCQGSEYVCYICN